MSNLLDRSSIVLTPTAYNNGEALCIKPDDGSGDFQFSRNSAATRVNAQGLVENVQILSSNLVQNPSFSEEGTEEISNGSFSQEGAEQVTNGDFATDSNWLGVNSDGVTISNGSLNYLNTPYAKQIIQTNVTTIGKTYKVTYTISNFVEGSIRFALGGNVGALRNANGTYTDYVTASVNNHLTFVVLGSPTTLSIENCSVREVGQDWTLLNAELTDNAVIIGQADGSISQFGQLGITTIGKQYKLSYDILEDNGGAFNLASPSTALVTTLGSHTVYYEANSADLFIKRASSSTTTKTTFTNISVKEVGQDWEFNSTAILTANGMNIITGGFIRQDVVTIGKSYKLTYDIVSYTSGNIRVYDGTDQGSIPTSVGSNTFNFTAGGSVFIIQSNSANVNLVITNISVIEITDDTNLPRINYEGFSYQDVLGSELVVNGDFATDSNWTKAGNVTIQNGVASFVDNGTNVNSYVQQNVLTANQTYIVTFEVTRYVSGKIQILSGSNTLGIVSVGVGTYKLQVESGSGTILRIKRWGTYPNFDFDIDNVSVKEYLGQEVVPNSGCGSWLFESQSTNLVRYSNDFSNANWNKSSNYTVQSNIGISPDGSLNASTITNTNGSGGFVFTSLPVLASTEYTVSFYAKRGTATEAKYSIYDGGDIIPSTSYYADITDSKYTRVSFSFTSLATSSTVRFYISRDDGAVGTVYVYGAQVEQKSYATSYIPTSGSIATRNKDVCKNGGSLATINSTEGTLYAEIAALANDGGNRIISLSNGSQAQRVIIFFSSTSNEVRAISANNSNQCDISFIAPNVLDYLKVAFKYKQNDFALWVNGIEVGTDTNGITSIGLNELAFDNASGGANFYGKTKAVAVWKEALSDQELADLTYPTPTDPTFSLDFDTIAEQFTFARGSEATYVDAQGLIQSTNEIGEELILNGGFDSDSDWTTNDWNISGGSLNGSASTGIVFQNNIGTTIGKTYKATLEISNYVSGSIRFKVGGSSYENIASTNGIQEFYFVAATSANNILFSVQSAYTGSIDNVSVKEYTTATNTPRLDYSTGAEAFLLEPQSTNLITQSELFSDSSWTKQNNATITSNSTMSPSGEIDADLLNCPTTSRLLNPISITSGVKYTFSIFIKKGTSSLFGVDLYDGGVKSLIYNFDTNVVSGGITDNSIEDYGNGWHKLSGTITPASTTLSCFIYGNGGYSENEANTYIWGAQLEQKSFATSYIPSNGSQTTRNQETCINATPEINSEQGVLYAEIASLSNEVTSNHISLSDGTYNNRVSLMYSIGTNVIRAFLRLGGAVQADMTFTVSDITEFHKVAFKFKENDFALWIDGVEVGTDTSGSTIPSGTLTKLAFSEISTTGGAFIGNTKDLQVYTKALSDAELINLTTI